jgi:hypothetical protein
MRGLANTQDNTKRGTTQDKETTAVNNNNNDSIYYILLPSMSVPSPSPVHGHTGEVGARALCYSIGGGIGRVHVYAMIAGEWGNDTFPDACAGSCPVTNLVAPKPPLNSTTPYTWQAGRSLHMTNRFRIEKVRSCSVEPPQPLL